MERAIELKVERIMLMENIMTLKEQAMMYMEFKTMFGVEEIELKVERIMLMDVKMMLKEEKIELVE